MRSSLHGLIVAGVLLAAPPAAAYPGGGEWVPPEGDKRGVPPEGDKRGVPPEGDKRGVPPLVVINFDLLPPGTVVDAQFPEVKFVTEPDVEIQTASVIFAPSPPNIICTVPIFGGDTCVAELLLFFVQPVGLLQFEVVGAKAAGQVAEVEVFELFSGVPVATLPILNDFTGPILVDLSTYGGVTAIRVNGISDPAGIGYDNFSFELSDDLIFLDGFESGDTLAWPVTVGRGAR